MNRPLALGVVLASLLGGSARADLPGPQQHDGIGSLANVNVQTVIGLPDEEATVIDRFGTVSLPPWRLRFGLGQPERFGDDLAPRQRVHEGDLPMTETDLSLGDVSCTLLAFRESRQGDDLIRAALRNTGAAPASARLVVRFEDLPGMPRLAGPELQVRVPRALDRAIAATTPVTSVVRADEPWGCVAPGATALPAWGRPNVPCDPAFANIRVGWGGAPITYEFAVESGARCAVYAGICESHWAEAGQRILDVKAEGAQTQTVDPIADHGQHVPFLVRFDAHDADRDGRLVVESVANRAAKDQNSILNAIWVFPANERPDDAALVAGRLDDGAMYYVDVGGTSDRLVAGAISLTYERVLPPGQTHTVWLRLAHSLRPAGSLPAVTAAEGQRLLAATKRYWRDLYRTLAQIRVPDPVAMDLYRMSFANIMISRDRIGQFYIAKPGETVYDSFWYRDGAYIVVALDRLGRHDLAEQSLRMFWREELPWDIAAWGQEPDGSWDCPENEWDGQGQALWALRMHYGLTRDEQWLREVYPAIRRGAQWIANARKQTTRPEDEGERHWGLLPEGVGEAIGDGYVFYHDFWGVAGLRWASEAARAAGETADAAWMDAERRDFERCLGTSLAQAFAGVADGRFIPADPHHADRRIWGGLAAVWPCEVLHPRDPMVDATWQVMEQRSAEGMYQFVTDPKMWPYMSCDWAQTYLLRHEPEKARRIFRSYIDHAAETRGWIEEVFVDSREGTGDMPHCWAAADYILLLRALLVNDAGGQLTLLEGVPAEWLTGDGISVREAPTLYGPVTLTARGSQARRRLRVDVKPPEGARTVGLRIAVPEFARGGRVLVNGREAETVDDHALVGVPEWPAGRSVSVVAEPR